MKNSLNESCCNIKTITGQPKYARLVDKSNQRYVIHVYHTKQIHQIISETYCMSINKSLKSHPMKICQTGSCHQVYETHPAMVHNSETDTITINHILLNSGCEFVNYE